MHTNTLNSTHIASSISTSIAPTPQEARLGQKDVKAPKMADVERLQGLTAQGHESLGAHYQRLGMKSSSASSRDSQWSKALPYAPRISDDKSKPAGNADAWVTVPEDWDADDEEVEEKAAPTKTLVDVLQLEKSIETLNTKLNKLTSKKDDATRMLDKAFLEQPGPEFMTEALTVESTIAT